MYKGVINGYEDQVWLNVFNIIINTLKFVGGLILLAYISSNITHYFLYQLLIGFIELIVIILLLNWADGPNEQEEIVIPTIDVPSNAVNTTTVTALAEVLTAITKTNTSTNTDTTTTTITATETGTPMAIIATTTGVTVTSTNTGTSTTTTTSTGT